MKHIVFLILMAAFMQQGLAQDNDRINAFKVGIFTQQMGLTTAESQVFWPMYNEYEAEKEALRSQYNLKGQFRRIDTMSDEETETLILKHFERDEKELQLKRTYFEKFKTILPIKKVAKIYKAERVFKQKLVQEMRRRRKG